MDVKEVGGIPINQPERSRGVDSTIGPRTDRNFKINLGRKTSKVKLSATDVKDSGLKDMNALKRQIASQIPKGSHAYKGTNVMEVTNSDVPLVKRILNLLKVKEEKP